MKNFHTYRTKDQYNLNTQEEIYKEAHIASELK